MQIGDPFTEKCLIEACLELLDTKLVVGIQDDSPLKKQGVCAGMVITAIAGHHVGTMLEVQRILNDVPPERCTVETAADTTEVAVARK